MLLLVFIYLGYELIIILVGVELVYLDIWDNDFVLIFEMIEVVMVEYGE